jgi:hypothetical protein
MAALLIALIARSAQAALTLTPAAVARGFSLTTWASGFPSIGDIGPLNVAYRPDGGVLVDNNDGNIYSFPVNADNQDATVTPITASYGAAFVPRGMAQTLFGKYYLAQSNDAGRVVEIDQNGTLLNGVFNLAHANEIAVFPNTTLASVDPNANHLFVDTPVNGGQIWNVDPANPGGATLFAQYAASGTVDIDGMTFSPDGAYLYVANRSGGQGTMGNSIRKYQVADPTIFFDFAGPAGENGLDGIGIGVGNLDGYVYLNYNDGTLWEAGTPLGPHAGEMTEIATGGTRGDFVAMNVDLYSGSIGLGTRYPSLMIMQTDRIMRLDPPGGGFFVSNMPEVPFVPEPSTMGLLLVAMAFIGVINLRTSDRYGVLFAWRHWSP